MTIDDLISKLSGVQPRGREFIADCPLHPSDGASLTVRREFGSIELECSKGCTDQEIARAIGLTPADLFDDDDKSMTGKFSPEADDEGEEETSAEEAFKPPIAYDAYGPFSDKRFRLHACRALAYRERGSPNAAQALRPFLARGRDIHPLCRYGQR